jgi:anti-anti-sigma factor
MSLQVKSEKTGDVTVLSCTGDIDLGSASQLREVLVPIFNEAKPRLLMDLSSVGFMDSTGIGIMVNALNRVREKNGACAFCGAGQRVHRILQIAGLLNALPLYATRAEGLAALTGKNGVKSATESVSSAPRLASDAS